MDKIYIQTTDDGKYIARRDGIEGHGNTYRDAIRDLERKTIEQKKEKSK